MNRGLGALGVVLVLVAASGVQATDIGMSIRPDSITVGDSVTVELRLDLPAGSTVAFPRPQTPPRVQVLDVDATAPAADAAGAAKAGAWIGRYTLAVFDVGNVVLPPWPVQVKADTQVAIVYTDSIRLHVSSVLDDSLAAADIRDLKAQQDVPVPLPLWVWIALGALVLVAAFLYWRRRRRRPQATVAPSPPPVPPHMVALAELRQLEAQQLPASGKIKEHYVRLSEILRRYLEAAPQFGFTALEETTDEIRRELRERRYKQDVIDTLVALCEEADLVKFAKFEPTIRECEESLERVRRFVNESAQSSALALRGLEPAVVAS